MPDINPYIWATLQTFSTASGVGHLTLVATIAVGSAVVNYYLDRKGHTLAVKLLNRGLWILSGFIFMDFFFDVITRTRSIFHL